MKKFTLSFMLLICSAASDAQEYQFRKNINKDSLFNFLTERLPKQRKKELIKLYKEGNEQSREFLLFMIAMPRSSKKELIANYQNKKAEIQTLKNEYAKLVPKNYVVDIEFEAESRMLIIPEQITIKIYRLKGVGNDSSEVVSENWNLRLKSTELDLVLKTLGWTSETLGEIKNLLDNANCISIDNGKVTTIGFARSGMGKYSYQVFSQPLTARQTREYSIGCEYIVFNDHVVLEFGGGAVGPQCFEKE